MKISYRWLKEYLPKDAVFSEYFGSVSKVSEILTSVGLEVEAVERYESITGLLEGLIVGEVKTCEKHPNADRLKLTTVNTGSEIIQVVCGAPNVEAGQKVILARPGIKIFPYKGYPVILKKSKIRGIESDGMICSEDEVGLGPLHEGIVVLNPEAIPGTPVAYLYPVYHDYIYEIGLTPNRMDDQSHLGVAKDVCAWLSHHIGKEAKVVSPLGKGFPELKSSFKIEVEVKSPELCSRYSGVVISAVTIAESPRWLQAKLKSLGLKPINNVVDITNFILHSTGQPLHSFDADKIGNHKVIVETLPEGTSFTTLDEKERKLSTEDIMICDGNNIPMCIGGVFGGLNSGVKQDTKNIFLESAVFNSTLIRKTMIRHDLRTDAATRFEKGVDVSKCVEVLKYAASLICELGKGEIASEIIDVYNKPEEKNIFLSYAYLKRLSGKEFEPAAVQNILKSLGFVISSSDEKGISVIPPFSNPDISLPADVVEEILRIDGLDNVPIPEVITMATGHHDRSREFSFDEKIASWLTGNGFQEIFTNSITSDRNVETEEVPVRIMNSLSEELTILRTNMLAGGLESIAYNINRQSKDLQFFEFGKTYSAAENKYTDANHLAIYCTGNYSKKSWRTAEKPVDIYRLKGIAHSIFNLSGLDCDEVLGKQGDITFVYKGKETGKAVEVITSRLDQFGVHQPVYFLDLDIDFLRTNSLGLKVEYKPVNKFPSVTRDLAMIVEKDIPYHDIENLLFESGVKKLTDVRMFDLYENEKIGNDKKSIAIRLTFEDAEKTLTDKETESMMQKIVNALNSKLNAEIRSHA